MSGPDEKEEKKKVETAKKSIQTEVKKLVQKTKKPVNEMQKLLDEKKELDKKKDKTPADKKREKEILKEMGKLLTVCKKESSSASNRISQMLKVEAPQDKKALPVWQKGMDKWYVDILNKEPGFKIADGVRVNGDISIKDKKAAIDFTFKF